MWGLRWFSVGVFVLLFLMGLLLSVSWKILVCLAIIPVTAICFPKKVQSWVWVCLTGVLLGLFIWVLLPELNKENWKPYQFDTELQTLNNDHLPAGIDNAADRYSAIFDKHGETIFHYSFPLEDERMVFATVWDPQKYPELDAWMTGFEPALEQLIEIARMEHCRFAIPHDLPSLDPQLQRVNQIKRWVRMLICSANRDLYLGQTDAALDKLLTGLGLARHLYQQQTLFDHAGAIHIEQFASIALRRYIIDRCDNPEAMTQIRQAYARIDPSWPGVWPRITARSKLMTKNLAGLLYEVNHTGRIRMSRNAMPALAKGLNYRIPRWLRKQNMSKAATVGLWLFMPSSPDGLSTMIDERFDHYSRQVQRGEQFPKVTARFAFLLRGMNYKSIVDWLAMQQVQFYWALDEDFRQHQGFVRQAEIFCVLKRYHLAHGCWPEQLEMLELGSADNPLADPVHGKPYVYEQLGDGFRMYGLGANDKDDGGLNSPKEGKDDVPLWPRNDVREDADVEPIAQPGSMS